MNQLTKEAKIEDGGAGVGDVEATKELGVRVEEALAEGDLQDILPPPRSVKCFTVFLGDDPLTFVSILLDRNCKYFL